MRSEFLDEGLAAKIRQIRLVVLDVDGVMTDGRIIMDYEGRESKNFNVKDGHGMKILWLNIVRETSASARYTRAFITNSKSPRPYSVIAL